MWHRISLRINLDNESEGSATHLIRSCIVLGTREVYGESGPPSISRRVGLVVLNRPPPHAPVLPKLDAYLEP